MAFVGILFAFGVQGGWSRNHYLIVVLAITGLGYLRWDLSNRAATATALEHRARALGLAPSAADPFVYEGTREYGNVRVWIGSGRTTVLDRWVSALTGLLGIAAGTWSDWWFVPVGLLAGVLVWNAWRNRPIIELEGVRPDGLRHRTGVRRVADIEAAMTTLPAVPATSERFPLPAGIDVPHLLSRVEFMRDEEAVLGALVALGETASPGALGSLMDALRKRRAGLSPRGALAAERAAARIRERHGIADQGALGLSEAGDSVGRIGLAGDSGAVSPLEPEK